MIFHVGNGGLYPEKPGALVAFLRRVDQHTSYKISYKRGKKKRKEREKKKNKCPISLHTYIYVF